MEPDEGDTTRDNRRRLGRELRRIRDLAGVSGRELAQLLDISQSKVSRIESGTALPTLPEVRAWAEAVDAPAQVRELLSALTEAAHTDIRSWRTELHDRPHLQNVIREVEATARTTRTFQQSVVPGLLQTAEYARQVFSMFQEVPYTKEGLAAALAGRLDRQARLYDEGRDFRFLITEGALRWRPGGPQLLAAQIDRVATLSTLSNVFVGVLPLSVPAKAPNSHGFTLYEPMDEEQDAFVNVEMIHANTNVYRPSDVELYRNRWNTLEETALHGDEARAFLYELALEMRREHG